MTDQLIFDVFANSAPNGSPLGTLTEAADKRVRSVWDGLPSGSFRINRHSAQAAWCATDNIVKARIGAGPYVEAFYIAEGQNVIISAAEEGGEDYTRGGGGLLQYLSRAIVYPTANASGLTGQIKLKDRVWRWPDTTPGVILADLLEDALARSPSPIEFLTYGFDGSVDSAGHAWEAIGDTFELPIGLDYLQVVAKLRGLKIAFHMTPGMVLQAYQDWDPPDSGVDFVKGENIITGGNRAIHATPAKTRVTVQGTTTAGNPTYRTPVDSALEAAIRRREGFVQYGTTKSSTALTRAGEKELLRLKRQDEGPTTIGALVRAGEVPFTDYQPGDLIHVDIPGEYDDVDQMLHALTLSDTDANEYDPTLEFEADAFDPLDALTDKLEDEDKKKPPTKCGDCPEPTPFRPEREETDVTGGVLYGPATRDISSGEFPIVFSGPGDGPDYPPGWPPEATDPRLTPYTGPSEPAAVGTYHGWIINAELALRFHFKTTVVGVAWGDEILTATLYVNSGSVGQATVGAVGTVHTLEFTTGTVGLVPGDRVHMTLTVNGVHGRTFFAPAGAGDHTLMLEIVDGIGATLAGTILNAPADGQKVGERRVSDGATTALHTTYAYAPGSLLVTVNGIVVNVDETDPTTGLMTLPAAVPAGVEITIRYQVEDPAPLTTPVLSDFLGHGGTVEDEPQIVPPQFLGEDSDASGDNILHDDGTWKPNDADLQAFDPEDTELVSTNTGDAIREVSDPSNLQWEELLTEPGDLLTVVGPVYPAGNKALASLGASSSAPVLIDGNNASGYEPFFGYPHYDTVTLDREYEIASGGFKMVPFVGRVPSSVRWEWSADGSTGWTAAMPAYNPTADLVPGSDYTSTRPIDPPVTARYWRLAYLLNQFGTTSAGFVSDTYSLFLTAVEHHVEPARVPIGPAGRYLRSDGNGPTWDDVAAADVTYDPGAGPLVATDVQAGIDELAAIVAAPATHVWMPLTSVVGGEPVLVWDGDDSLIPTYVPLD